MGTNLDDAQLGVNQIKNIEVDRFAVVPKKDQRSNDFDKEDVNDTDSEDGFCNLSFGHICIEMMEEVMDNNDNQVSSDFQVIPKKKKSSTQKKKKHIKRVTPKKQKYPK